MILTLLVGVYLSISLSTDTKVAYDFDRELAAPHELRAERHLGYFQLEAFLREVDRLSFRKSLEIQPTADRKKICFLRGKVDQNTFDITFYNRIQYQDLSRLHHLPFRLINEADRYGFEAEVKQIDSVEYLYLTNDVIMGVLQRVDAEYSNERL
ncbi:MAG: hypothetical protein AAFW73_13615 [Bacteroidota bacterium]